jgi:nucleoside-diphosphate-sugar epimerase
MKVLVLGGAGYLGQQLVPTLLGDVTVLDKILYNHEYMAPYNFVYGDVCDVALMKSILPKHDVVINLAAIVGDPACAAMQETAMNVNVNAVQTLNDYFGGRIIHMSSCSVYGAGSTDVVFREESSLNPLSFYAETKIMSEQILKNRKDTLIFRLGTLHGFPHGRIRMDLAVNRLVINAQRNKEISIFGGDQWRAFLGVIDIACLIKDFVGSSVCGIYNVATENMRISDLADIIKKYLPDTIVNSTDAHFEDKRSYRVDTSKFDKYFAGYSMSHTIEDTVLAGMLLFKQGRIRDFGHPYYSNIGNLSMTR